MDHDNRVQRLKEGKFELLGNYQTLFLNLLKADASVVLGSAGETDEVVTIDVRRQIRWPTSLHGKSGMRVSEFPWHGLTLMEVMLTIHFTKPLCSEWTMLTRLNGWLMMPLHNLVSAA